MTARGETVRAGLVGFGLGGEVFHAPLIGATSGMELRTIVTANPERAARARSRYPETEVLPDLGELWRRDLDLVVVATPNRAHVPIALEAISRGLHVVVDKPLAPTAADGRRALRAAAERGVVLSVFQNRRWDGDFLTVRRLIGEGALGGITRFESRFERFRPAVPADAWRELGAPEEGGGLLLDLGSHLVDQAVQLFGAPIDVFAEVDRRRPGTDVDDDVFVSLRHADGVRSHLWMSAVAGSLGPRFRVLGLGGGFEKHGLDPQEAQLEEGRSPGEAEYGVEDRSRWGVLSRGEDDRTAVPTERGAYGAYYSGIADAIAGSAPPPVDPADAVAVLEVLEAARRSAESRAVVELE